MPSKEHIDTVTLATSLAVSWPMGALILLRENVTDLLTMTEEGCRNPFAVVGRIATLNRWESGSGSLVHNATTTEAASANTSDCTTSAGLGFP